MLRREMTISESQLFEYTIPALLFLFAGVFLFNKDVDLAGRFKQINRVRAARLGHLLLFISFASELLPYLGFSGAKSILSFTYFLRYAGAMCYLFSPSLLNYSLLSLVYVLLLRDALRGGIFVDFLVWTAYLFLMIGLVHRFTFKVRASFVLLAAPVLIVIQAVKNEYRDATWAGKRESGIGYFTELAGKTVKTPNDSFEDSDGVISTVGRLNQGWHLGMVLKRVPKKEPFADGEDLLSDLGGVILPRVFFPDKKVIGGQDKFERYTGHDLIGSTSMTIGVLGDFYINFGVWGSFIGLFIFGALMARILYWFIKRYVLPDPINIIWLPFLFTYLIRANNDFYIVVNHLFKGLLIFYFISFLMRKIWPEDQVVRK